MTVTAQRPFASYVGNGTSTVYTFPFPVFDQAHVVVAVDGVTKTLGTHYTVSGVGGATGSITFTSGNAPPSASIVTIRRVSPRERKTDYQRGGDLSADTLDADLDRIWLSLQEMAEDNSRGMLLPIGDPYIGVSLPVPSLRAGRALIFDANGQPTVSTDLWSNAVSQSAANAASAALSATAAANSASLARNVFLGAYAADPTLKPDGSPLTASCCYFNTSTSRVRIYSGTVWQDAYAPPSSIPRASVMWSGSSTPTPVDSYLPATPSAGLLLGTTGTVTIAQTGTPWSAGVFTAPIAGHYQVTLNAIPSYNVGTAYVYVYPLVNDLYEYRVGSALQSSSFPGPQSATWTLSVPSGGTIKLRAFSNGSTALSVPTGAITIAYIGPV